jgi:hypothetical protein
VGYSAGVNFYSYALGDPINGVDPSGNTSSRNDGSGSGQFGSYNLSFINIGHGVANPGYLGGSQGFDIVLDRPWDGDLVTDVSNIGNAYARQELYVSASLFNANGTPFNGTILVGNSAWQFSDGNFSHDYVEQWMFRPGDVSPESVPGPNDTFLFTIPADSHLTGSVTFVATFWFYDPDPGGQGSMSIYDDRTYGGFTGHDPFAGGLPTASPSDINPPANAVQRVWTIQIGKPSS